MNKRTNIKVDKMMNDNIGGVSSSWLLAMTDHLFANSFSIANARRIAYYMRDGTLLINASEEMRHWTWIKLIGHF